MITVPLWCRYYFFWCSDSRDSNKEGANLWFAEENSPVDCFRWRGNERSEAIGTAVPRKNPFRRAIKREFVFADSLLILCMKVKRIRTCEGLSVKETVQWTVFSEEHNANTSFALWIYNSNSFRHTHKREYIFCVLSFTFVLTFYFYRNIID